MRQIESHGDDHLVLIAGVGHEQTVQHIRGAGTKVIKVKFTMKAKNFCRLKNNGLKHWFYNQLTH